MKKLTFQSFGLTDKDVTAQKRIDPRAAMAILGGDIAGTERLDCYVYRIAPKPPFAPKGTPAYLCRLETPKTFDEVKEVIGGGVFRFVGNSFSEKDEISGQKKTVVDFVFEIDGPPLAERVAGPAPWRGGQPPLDGGPAVAISRPVPSQGNRVDEELAFLQKAKLYKEVFGTNGSGGAEKFLDVFLKGMQMGKDLVRDSEPKETTGFDLFKEVLQIVKQQAPARPRPAAPFPSPAAEVHVEPPAVAVAGDPPPKGPTQLNSLALLVEYVMDSFDEGKAAGKTAEEIVAGVPISDLANIFVFTDDKIAAIFENSAKEYEGNWMGGRTEEKRAWIGETVKIARSLLPTG
jgi:hypothetical protein